MNRAPLVMIPIALLSSGCTVVIDARETQCETTEDCEARGFERSVCAANVCEKAEPWGCLGDVVEPAPDKTKTVALSVRVVLAGSKTAVTDAVIDVCEKLDVDCTAASPTAPKKLKPDNYGYVNFSVAQGFDGFVRITGADLMDSRVFVGRPIVRPPEVKEVRLILKSDYQLLAQFAGEMVDPKRGTAILYAVDCLGLAASGVRFEEPSADAVSQEFYLINQAPTPPPTAMTTDVDGFGGFFNLPVGPTLARSFRAEGDVYVGESSYHILANTISYVQIAPTPK